MACPVKHDATKQTVPEGIITPAKSAPSSSGAGGTCGYNEAANDLSFNQEKQVGQKLDLSRTRHVSTIPKSDISPAHQPSGVDRWVYPSEQQYFNAMKRKGYEVDESQMGVILAIHNTVNERGWQQILDWEMLRGCTNPKLKRFMGRPKDLSPKARFLTMLGAAPPFDRHDWIVDRNGKEVRYVIDFYAAPASSRGAHQMPLPVHLDVRPALDSVSALVDRVVLQTRRWFTSWRS